MIISNLREFVLRRGIAYSAIFFLALNFACKDEGALTPEFNTSGIGVEEDSLFVTTSTVYSDSVRTDRVSRMLVGKLNDATYGLSTSEFCGQLMLSTSQFETPDAVTGFDSIVLTLSYTAYYGYTTDLDIDIYELEEDLDPTKQYYSTEKAQEKSELLAQTVLKLDTADTSAMILRVKLDDALTQSIYSQNTFGDNDAWLQFFKGIKVTTKNMTDPTGDGEGALVYFDITDSDSKMELFYRDNGVATSYEFEFNANSQVFSSFENDFSQSSIPAIIGKEDQELNHLMSLGGLRTELTFELPDKFLNRTRPISINKAELVIPFDDPTYDPYSVADRLVLIHRDDADTAWVLPEDYFKSGADYFDGTLRAAPKEYRFNLASTIHDIINNGRSDLKLQLSISGNSVTGHRMNIFSGKGGARKIYLLLTYSNP